MTYSDSKLLRAAVAMALCGLLQPVQAQTSGEASEDAFLGEVPIVLSVSRIAQRLDETPASVTVLDRDMIRQTGARDVAALLRFVPGFQVSESFESNAPQANYQLSLKDFSNRMQVLVDGRSVYSPFLFGSIGPGLQAVAVDDIERIEVVRGTNAAAYGARAFLGMINIVTRDAAGTIGASVQVASGSNGLRDALARVGWGGDGARFRVTVDHRSDSGLLGAGGTDFVNRLNVLGTIQASSEDRLDVRAGQTVISSGVGFAEWDDGGIRDRWIETSYVQLDWLHIVNADEDLSFQYSHTKESLQDLFPNTTFTDVVMDLGGTTVTENALLQHSYRFSPALRGTWGAELRRESVNSLSVFDTHADLSRNFYRLFVNAEWHVLPSLILNAGNMFERDTDSGDTNSPRAMLNWQVASGNTVRYGVTKAYRPPSTFENFSHQVYRSASLAAAGYPDGFVNFQSTGGLAPESILTRELGYLGNFDSLGASFDIRLFDEEITNVIKERKTANGYTKYYVNTLGAISPTGVDYPLNLHGAEFQVQWRPWEGAKFLIGYSWIDNGQLTPRQEFTSGSVMYRQEFGEGFGFSLMYSQKDGLQEFPYNGVPAPAVSRTDIRVVKKMLLGSSAGELSVVLQNLGPKYQDYDPQFYFLQQAYVKLTVDF